MPSLRLLPRYIAAYLLSPSPMTPSYWTYFRQRPLIFSLWVQLRHIVFVIRSKLTFRKSSLEDMPLDGVAGREALSTKVIPHNKRGLWAIQRARTERLLQVLRCITDLNPRDAKVLCIGPRNEAEILLFALHGFQLKNITGIDLFTYSPHIQVMDMHDLKFADDSFDLVYSAFVLTYSYDIQRACREMLRVTRDRGFIAAGFSSRTEHNRVAVTKLFGHVKEFHSYFDGHIRNIYWQEEPPPSETEVPCTTIFSVSK